MGGAAGTTAHEPDIPSAEAEMETPPGKTLREQIEATRMAQANSLRTVQELRRGQQDIHQTIRELMTRSEDKRRTTGGLSAQGDHGPALRTVGTMDSSLAGSDVERRGPPPGPPDHHHHQPRAFKQNNAKWLRQQLSDPGPDKAVTKSMTNNSAEGRRSQSSADGSGAGDRRQSLASATGSLESVVEDGTFTKAPQSSWWTRALLCAAAVVSSRKFDVLVALVILANSLTIGVEIQWGVDGRDEEDMRFLDRLEDAFLAFYTVEICVRLLGTIDLEGGKRIPRCVKSSWFWMDVVLVSTGIITQWILSPLLEKLLDNSQSMDTTSIDLVGQVLIIRILRLLRLVRALRTITFFQDLWKLVNGVLGSLRTVLSALFLLVSFTFVFACLSVHLIIDNPILMDNPETAEIVEERFSNLPMAMLTLLQFSDADSIGEIYFPLITTDVKLLVYFGLIFILFTIALMNLVTAVIVEHAIECSKYDREMEQVRMRKRLKTLQPQILKVFREMDESGNGNISIGELKDWQFQKKSMPNEIRDLVMPDALADLFEFLDTDNSGEIDQDEFVDGISHLALSNSSVEVTQILQLLRDSKRCLESVVGSMGGQYGPEVSPHRRRPGSPAGTRSQFSGAHREAEGFGSQSI